MKQISEFFWFSLFVKQSLPGLSTYAATKVGLRFWNDALRVEMKKYGVDVVNFIPGSLVHSTNITARQEQYATEMSSAFTDEQSEFYRDYFNRYNEYLKHISGVKPVQIISDGNLFAEFRNAIVDVIPKATYKCEPTRYFRLHATHLHLIGILSRMQAKLYQI